jgi:hypothetical protein
MTQAQGVGNPEGVATYVEQLGTSASDFPIVATWLTRTGFGLL